jgi:hypothetical protein
MIIIINPKGTGYEGVDCIQPYSKQGIIPAENFRIS